MNPLEALVAVFTGALLLLMINQLVNELSSVSNDELDLKNILSIRQRGLDLNAGFKAVYTPASNGTLNITIQAVKLNNASLPNPGLRQAYCSYDSIIINGSELKCLRN